MSTEVYGASPIKRNRRTNEELDALDGALLDVAKEHHPITVRGLFYQAVGRGLVGKLEKNVKLVGRRCLQLRRKGRMPYSWIVDQTRYLRKPHTHAGLLAFMEEGAAAYRRALWASQPVRVEFWCEKLALVGVIEPETARYDVPLHISIGYSGETYLHTVAEEIQAAAKPVIVYQLGDHDPSGVNIPVHIERELRRMAPGAEIHFTRLAITPEQIERWALPTRPTKKSDSRAKTFKGESVELDAVPPHQLRALVRQTIEQHINWFELGRLEEIQQQERKLVASVAAQLRDVEEHRGEVADIQVTYYSPES
jgi:hypothetical protein